MFYVFHGEDTHTKSEWLAELLGRHGDPAMLELNTTQFNGAVPVAQVRQAAETIPFLAPIRIVIISDLFSSNPGKQYLEELLAFLPHVPETTRLIVLESKTLSNNHPVILLARQTEVGQLRAFPLPEGSQLYRWIQEQAAKKGGKISPRAANLLASLVGNDLLILDNELEKLVAYKAFDPENTIEDTDVNRLSPYVAEASIFDLVDALGNRNEKAASTLYQHKLDEGADPYYLYSMFVRQFRLLIQVKELAESSYHPPVIARELGLHEYVAGKLNQQARGFSMQELEKIFRRLLEVDVAVKTGRADIRTSLDLLVAQLTLTP